MCSSRAALAAGIMRCWSSGSLGQGGGCRANLLSWIQEGRLAPSGICLVGYHGIKSWREEGSEKAGSHSRITSSRLRSDASQ